MAYLCMAITAAWMLKIKFSLSRRLWRIPRSLQNIWTELYTYEYARLVRMFTVEHSLIFRSLSRNCEFGKNWGTERKRKKVRRGEENRFFFRFASKLESRNNLKSPAPDWRNFRRVCYSVLGLAKLCMEIGKSDEVKISAHFWRCGSKHRSNGYSGESGLFIAWGIRRGCKTFSFS